MGEHVLSARFVTGMLESPETVSDYCIEMLAGSHETLRKAAQELLEAADYWPEPGAPREEMRAAMARSAAARSALRSLLAGDQPKEGNGDG